MNGYVTCHNEWKPMKPDVITEMHDALTDMRNPVENAVSLGIIDLWNRTGNPFWMRVWLELNADTYQDVNMFKNDLVEIFGL